MPHWTYFDYTPMAAQPVKQDRIEALEKAVAELKDNIERLRQRLNMAEEK